MISGEIAASTDEADARGGVSEIAALFALLIDRFPWKQIVPTILPSPEWSRAGGSTPLARRAAQRGVEATDRLRSTSRHES